MDYNPPINAAQLRGQGSLLYDPSKDAFIQHQVSGTIGQAVTYRNKTTDLPQIIKTKEKESMFKEIRTDVQVFIKEHKSVIYWTLLLYIVDYYCFDGALKGRLQKIVQNLVGKVESKLDKVDV